MVKRQEIAQKKVTKLEEEKKDHMKRLQQQTWLQRELEEKPKVDWTKEKFDFVAERRKLKEAKEKEKEMALEQLRLQQEMNLEKIFMAKKELDCKWSFFK